MKSLILFLGCMVAVSAQAQLRKVTLGVTTHCPYGVGGCWAEIRNGLNIEAIEALPQRPDTKTQTFDLHMRESWVPDPAIFARNFTNMNVGVDVRGVEALVDGSVEMEGTNLVLRANGNGLRFKLAPLQQKIQWDVKRKRPEAPTRSERKAFGNLAARFRGESRPVRVTGPLTKNKEQQTNQMQLTIQVRKFEFLNPVM